MERYDLLIKEGHNLPERTKKIYMETTPNIWIDEFNKLPNSIKITLGSKTFISLVKKYYYNRCQHSEIKNSICNECRIPHSFYRSPMEQLINSRVMSALNEIEWCPDINKINYAKITTKVKGVSECTVEQERYKNIIRDIVRQKK